MLTTTAETVCSCWPWCKRSTSSEPAKMPSPALTCTEYFLEGTKISLSLLKGVADLIPIPYVGFAVQTVSKLLEAGEQIHSNKEELDVLNSRVCALLLVMIAPMRGKRQQDIPPDLESDLSQLKSEIERITETLQEIAKQRFLWALLFKNLNTGKIQDCSKQLQASLDKFEVSRRISEAVRLCEISAVSKEGLQAAKESLSVAGEGLGVAKFGLHIAQEGLDIAKNNHDLATEGVVVAREGFSVAREGVNVAREGLGVARDGLGVAKESLAMSKTILDAVKNPRAHTGTSIPSLVMPSKPALFHGRDPVINDIVRRVTEGDSPRIAILGPGGMGKTAVALAVMEHVKVKAKFGNSCFWVPCVEATSPSLLLDLLAASLRITHHTDPRVVLLDNFETPWHLKGSKVEEYLCALAKIPHLAILLTMRSNRPPSDDIKWDMQWSSLPALDEDAARQVYVETHPVAVSDPQLDPLLDALGRMPLAITLMAKVGRNSDAMPTELLKDWNNPSIRTDLLDDGSESKNNINISVRISVDSRYMQANPNAIALLGILSMLPGGTRRGFLPQLAPNITSIPRALDTLTKSSLAEVRTSTQSISIQPVISAYVLRHHPPTSSTREAVYRAFYKFVEDHKSEPGDSRFVDDTRALATEETNIQAILLEAGEENESAEDALDALLSFSQYQKWTIPRTEVVEYAVQAAKAAQNKRCIAEGLCCQGSILLALDRYDEACIALKESRGTFQELGDTLRAARCLLALGEVYWLLDCPNDTRKAAEDAQEEFQTVQDARGNGETMLLLGKCHWDQDNTADSRLMLGRARQEFLNLNLPLGAAHCRYFFARNDELEGNYSSALTTIKEARREYERLACPQDAALCLTSMGQYQRMQSLHSEALETLQQGVKEHLQLGRSLGVAHCLLKLGDVHWELEHYDLARDTYREAKQLYQRINSPQAGRLAQYCSEMLEKDQNQ